MMSTLKRFPVAAFCLLTVLLSYGSYLTPIPRAALPFILVMIPALVAITLLALTEEKGAVRSLLGQLTQWRMGGPRWVLLALALALTMRLAVAGIAQFLGLIPAVPLLPQNWTTVMLLAVVYLVAAILEELGWRGFALTRLLRRYSPAVAALILGIPWGAVHIVLHLPGMWAEGLPWLPTVVQLTALSLVITWLFIHSGHNVLLVALFHAAQSAFGFVNEGVSPLHLTWLMAAVWAFAGLLALVDLVTMGRGLEIGELEVGELEIGELETAGHAQKKSPISNPQPTNPLPHKPPPPHPSGPTA
jgi:membrane protease YdiL (CAAX protease family)